MVSMGRPVKKGYNPPLNVGDLVCKLCPTSFHRPVKTDSMRGHKDCTIPMGSTERGLERLPIDAAFQEVHKQDHLSEGKPRRAFQERFLGVMVGIRTEIAGTQCRCSDIDEYAIRK
jgi:hypothetical protein